MSRSSFSLLQNWRVDPVLHCFENEIPPLSSFIPQIHLPPPIFIALFPLLFQRVIEESKSISQSLLRTPSHTGIVPQGVQQALTTTPGGQLAEPAFNTFLFPQESSTEKG